MYLKELTLRGFKSFASATTLRFEPGITAVVGPNGSGKSNIVDALTWVMGEQGARNLRGTSMEDVIFAGTSSRPALGRAQVSLTIDNTDHALDIDYTEVTISRTIFRNGGSEYAINGSPCRLLDIQELLSDTGLGQQMHVIVGQGRLDQILRADPAGHRAFIEEAAGVLKHRKRKERALRKLANTDANLRRLDDLLGEIHRQLGPLGRQARVSRRADAIKVTLRDAQSRLYAEDAVKAMRRRDRAHEELTAVRGDLNALRRELAQVKVRIEQVEAQAGEADPAIERLDRSWHELTQLKERFGSLAALADERGRALSAAVTAERGEDPDILDHRATELDQQAADARDAERDARLALEQATEARAADEQRLAGMRRTIAEIDRASRERDARAARMRELIAREEAAVELGESRGKDLAAQRESLIAQQRDARTRLARLREQAETGGDDGNVALDEARAALDERRTALDALLAEQRDLQSAIISLDAKSEALKDTLESRGDAGSLESDPDVTVLGRLADLIHVADGWEEAVAHALDGYAGALVVPDDAAMLAALRAARERRIGKAAVINAGAAITDVAGAPADAAGNDAAENDAAAGASTLAALVTANPQAADPALAARVAAAVRMLLADTVAVDRLEDAQRILAEGKAARAVTRAGDMLVARIAASGGSGSAQSDLSLAARRDKALRRAKELAARLEQLEPKVSQARTALAQASANVDAETRRRTEARIKAEQAHRETRDVQTRLDGVTREIARLDERLEAARGERENHRTRLADLNAALAAESEGAAGRQDAAGLAERAHALETALATARDQEVAAKIAWTEAKRRAESLQRQSALLHVQAREARERRARLDRLAEERRERAARVREVARKAAAAAAKAEQAVAKVVAERDGLRAAAAGRNETLRDLRERRNGLEPKVGGLAEREHALDVDRERYAGEYAQIERKTGDELGMSVGELVAEYGPDRPVPVLDEHGRPVPVEHPDAPDADGTNAGGADGSEASAAIRTTPYVREEQERRLDKAKRDLAKLGKVNPLATEEYEALEERNRYLNGQRDDVARSRDDLMRLIHDLDATMVDVFRTAFDDTAKAFEQVFATLFPGGTGRLRLERPDDLLSTGVVVEASPAGKRVKQLSLLSGGERSLTALALLFAIFTARPSPFYVMDEVEAALDDVNLTRLLDALNDLREHAQLIVITHQQRTMSIADALYGVTMRADGVTAVVSQKLDGGLAIAD
ncbi:chromosome segregation protein SMC [Bifidobacterium parmae]|uniref:Chromosome partition protein Smc n=1 Tax=Bifidobacterium parmae TaxID=361854 RepID=A0A2N5J2Z5_9BIFI|nr:chromosome segregation protein SMC [Bifidobacterium parmae]PLS28595.1 chromosome segregation protein SMC [Bifidobacterium parmae]